MTERVRLPARRGARTYRVAAGGMTYHATFATDGAGAPVECFLVAGKPGSSVEAAARDAGIVLSLALQWGVPAGAIRDALTEDHDGAAAGPIAAALDALAAELAERTAAQAAAPGAGDGG